MQRILFRFSVVLVCASIMACRAATEPDVIVPSLPAVPGASVLLFDSFDNENSGVGQNNWTNFQHWNVVAGCVDLHGNGFYDVQAGNGIYVDLDGSCESAGTIESKETFALASGQYVLEFWLAGNNRITTPDTVVVSLGTLFQEQFVLQSNERFRLITRSVAVTATTTARLRFQASGGDNQGALLDQVRLRRGS
jgi:hypothetical protein